MGPGFQAEAEAVGEPVRVEPQIYEEALRLAAEKAAERLAVRDAVRIGGIATGIALERAITADKARRAFPAAQPNLLMALVFERGFGEFGAGVESGKVVQHGHWWRHGPGIIT